MSNPQSADGRTVEPWLTRERAPRCQPARRRIAQDEIYLQKKAWRTINNQQRRARASFRASLELRLEVNRVVSHYKGQYGSSPPPQEQFHVDKQRTDNEAKVATIPQSQLKLKEIQARTTSVGWRTRCSDSIRWTEEYMSLENLTKEKLKELALFRAPQR